MSNKPQLQTNNADLASLTNRVLVAKDIASNLPEAGSGSSINTCTITKTIMSPMIAGDIYISYIDSNGDLVNADFFTAPDSIKVACPSIVSTNTLMLHVSGNAEFHIINAITNSSSFQFVYVTGDCTVSY